MKRILILGGTGYTGRLLARHLLEQSDAEITIATRHLDKAKALADELKQQYPNKTIAAVFADAANADSLRTAFRGQDLVVVAAPTTAHTENVVRAALETGADYLDVQISAEKFSLLQSFADEIKCSGRCFITEAGFHPGLPAAMVRYTAGQFDSIESANTIGYLSAGKNLPYTESFDELAEFFKTYQSQAFENGQWTNPHAFVMRSFDLGGDLGQRQCFSMYLEELGPLPTTYPTLKNAGFFMSETHWITDMVVSPLVILWLKINPKAVRQAGRLIWRSMSRFSKPPYRTELTTIASGCKDGQQVKIHLTVGHPDVYGLTAIPVAAAILQYMEGTACKPGLWMMGYIVEPERLMKDMETMGVLVKTTVE